MPENASCRTEPRLAGHPVANQLVAQRGLFRGPNPVCPEDLYLRVVAGAADRERHRVVVRARSRVTTDTYFGRFPASYWQRWTVVDSVGLELVVTGSGRLTLVASNASGRTRVLEARAVEDVDGTEVRLDARLDRFVDGGFLWLDIETDEADLVVERLCWTVAPPELLRPTALVICTFNRADDCLATLDALRGDQAALDLLDAVYVVDQGTDLVWLRPGFAEVAHDLRDRLRYLRQPNLGGSGGFSRGLYEVAEVSHAEHANVLFMDDDVLCEPEVVIRLTAFANRTAEPSIVGGQMLRLLNPTQLHVVAEYADFVTLTAGQVIHPRLRGVDLLGETVAEETETDKANRLPAAFGNPSRIDRRVDAAYNGWWACLIPSEVVAAIGYPLPLFLKWDDVEYGYRASEHGHATVTLPGAGLWHMDFDWKDHDDWSEYFVVRNALITAALRADVDPKQTARKLLSTVVHLLLAMRYGQTATLLKAVEDYLTGPDILRDGGAAAVAEVRALRARYPDTVLHKPINMPGLRPGEIPMTPAGPTPSMPRAVLLKRLIYLALGKTVHQIGAVPEQDGAWWHVSLFDTAVVTDAAQDGVRLRKRDRRTVLRLATRAARIARRLVTETPRVRREYRAALSELAARENWARLFGL